MLYGLAITSFKLGQFGDAALFAERGLTLSTARERFFYLLAATRRLLCELPGATDYYSRLLDCCQLDPLPPLQAPQIDLMKLKETDLLPAIRSSGIRFFARFSDESIRELLKSGEIQVRNKGSLLLLEHDQACVLLTGQVCARSHSGNAVHPTVLWRLTPGDYLTWDHQEIVGSVEVWSRFEVESALLILPEKKLNEQLRKERVTSKDILVKTFQAFPLFSDLHLSTLELVVYDLMSTWKYTEGETIQTRLNGVCKEPFQVILSGLCSLTVPSLDYEAAFLGRGDFYCEEELMQGQRGFASAGDIVAKSAVEVAKIDASSFYKLPAYEVEKMRGKAAAKGQVEFVLHRIEKQRVRQKHVRRSTAL